MAETTSIGQQMDNRQPLKPLAFNLVKLKESTQFLIPCNAPEIAATVATASHVYIIYFVNKTDCYSGHLKMARLCKLTRSWELINTEIPFTESIFSSGLLKHETMLIFCKSKIHFFDLKTLTWGQVDTDQVRTLFASEDGANSQVADQIHFHQHAIDNVNSCIYVMCSASNHNYFIGRLQWDTKQWTRLNVVGEQPCLDITYLAYWQDKLYMGDSAPYIKPDEKMMYFSYFYAMYTLDLNTLECVKDVCEHHGRDKWNIRLPRMVDNKFVQIGSKVYAVCRIYNTEITLNAYELWSLDLPNHTWTRHLKFQGLREPLNGHLMAASENPNELWIFQEALINQSLPTFAYQVPVMTVRSKQKLQRQ